MEQRTLKAAYTFYCGKELNNAHSADADVIATYEVLKAQLTRYADKEWEDKSGKKSIPVQNDVEALHRFTNLSRPVDFAGRMVYNEDNQEIFSFGKHKGRTVEEVFRIEPSYYSWMMQGDFPLYTKRCLENIWNRMRNAPGQEGRSQQPPQRPQQPQAVQDKKPVPITTDMLQDLKNKFRGK